MRHKTLWSDRGLTKNYHDEREAIMTSRDNARILVTGATGVLGTATTSALRDLGAHVSVVQFKADITDRRAVKTFFSMCGSFTHLIHAAAIVQVSDVESDPERAYVTNAIGTSNVISEFLDLNPSAHVTYVSSSHVYASSDHPLRETDELAPSGLYGRTKLAGENLAKDLVRFVAPNQLCIGRVFSLFSDHQTGSFLLPSLRSNLRQGPAGPELEIAGWNNVRDFSSVSYHASALAYLSVGKYDGVFNIGSGKGQTILDFAGQMMSFTQLNKSETKASNPTRLVADISKLVSTGFQATSSPAQLLA